MRLLILLLLKMLKELKFRLVGKQGRRREDGGEGKRERERGRERPSGLPDFPGNPEAWRRALPEG